ncbi:hypothetical protein [Ruania alba]|uniref:hypothetical protein n=1 Tax=Ruania alba TaxID=648782 RepID=UPI001C317D38|nr:hypothetical protein [Ruania alba]
MSEDDGHTWRTAVVLEDGRTPVHPDLPPSLPPSDPFDAADDGVRTTGVGEYSYPAAVLDGHDLLITYTWQRRGIVAVTVPLEKVLGRNPA